MAFVESPFKAQPPLSCGYRNGSREAAPNSSPWDLFFFNIRLLQRLLKELSRTSLSIP